jgi:peptidoglycan/LPS O-acetylase OafA/YrhL
LWSLGVEEQFYIFWPCLIALGLKIFKKRTFLILALYTVLSFIFGIVSVYKNPKFAFYFPLCRFWQMAVGGLVAYCSHKITNSKINNALSVSGTAAILITVWIINDESLFPGFWALVPTLASACIIQAGSEALINKHVLSNKVMVFVGKISYPMYLWHWPLLVFSKYLFPEGSTSIFGNVFFMIALTVCFSILTYFFVENPIRRRKSRKMVVVLLILSTSIGVLSYVNLSANRITTNDANEVKI